MVNGIRHDRSLVVLSDRLITDWNPANVAALSSADLTPLAVLGCEIVILATGAKLRFPRPEILRPLLDAHIGVEVMNVPAACRTYNILLAEDRKVAAAFLLG